MKKIIGTTIVYLVFGAILYSQNFNFSQAVVCGWINQNSPYEYADEKYEFEEGEAIFSWVKFTDISGSDIQVKHEWFRVDDPSTPVVFWENTFACCGWIVSTAGSTVELEPGEYYAVISARSASNPFYTEYANMAFTIKPVVTVRISNMDNAQGIWNINQSVLIGEIDKSNYLSESVKIAADGTEATLVEVLRSGNTSYLVFPEGDPTGVQTEHFGKFELEDFDDERIRFRYTHPVELTPGYYKMKVVNEETGAEALFFYMRIVRPPVLLLHGRDQTSGNMALMKDFLNGSGYAQFQPNYVKSGNYPSKLRFTYSYPLVGVFCQEQIQAARENLVSAGAVDVVGYSMGGLLARMYLQSPTYAKNMNKLITINTPHSGSKLANHPLAYLVAYLTNDWSIPSLSPQGDDILNTLNGSGLNAHVVPSHAITSTDPGVEVNCTAWVILTANTFWSILDLACLNGDGFCFSQTVTACIAGGPSNDWVVTLPSQIGGLNAYSTANDINHFEAHTHGLNLYKVNNLLGQENSSTEFSTGGFHPPIINATHQQDVRNALELHLVAPSVQDTLQPGQTVQFTVAGSPTITHVLLSIYGVDADTLHLQQFSGGNFTYSFDLPANITGELRVGLIGIDDLGEFVMDTLGFTVQTTVTTAALPGKEVLSLQIAPQPVSEVLFLNAKSVSGAAFEGSILTVSGQTVHSFRGESGSEQQLEVGYLPAGVYALKVQDGRQTAVVKFLKL